MRSSINSFVNKIKPKKTDSHKPENKLQRAESYHETSKTKKIDSDKSKKIERTNTLTSLLKTFKNKPKTVDPYGSWQYLKLSPKDIRIINANIGEGNTAMVKKGIILVGLKEQRELGLKQTSNSPNLPIAIKTSKEGKGIDKHEADNICKVKKRINDLNKRGSIYDIDLQNLITPSTPTKITDDIHTEYVIVCPFAEHGNLKDFILDLASGGKITAQKDPRVVAAFNADPINFMLILLIKMRQTIEAMHSLGFIHADVAARNFLVFDFAESDFVRDTQHNVVGLDMGSTNGFLMISDLGLSQDLNIADEELNLNLKIKSETVFAMRWLDTRWLIEHELSIMSDFYSFRCTIITVLGFLMGFAKELAMLNLHDNIAEKNLEFSPERITLNNAQTIDKFSDNLFSYCTKKKTEFLAKSRLSDSELRELQNAHTCLVILEGFKEYLLDINNIETEDYVPSTESQKDASNFVEGITRVIDKLGNNDDYYLDTRHIEIYASEIKNEEKQKEEKEEKIYVRSEIKTETVQSKRGSWVDEEKLKKLSDTAKRNSQGSPRTSVKQPSPQPQRLGPKIEQVPVVPSPNSSSEDLLNLPMTTTTTTTSAVALNSNHESVTTPMKIL